MTSAQFSQTLHTSSAGLALEHFFRQNLRSFSVWALMQKMKTLSTFFFSTNSPVVSFFVQKFKIQVILPHQIILLRYANFLKLKLPDII